MTPTIEAIGLRKRFGKTVALDGLDLVAEPGQVRAVATLLRPDGGELRVAGHDVRREPKAVRRIIGLAGQYAAVEPAMTGRENLEMVARLFGHDARSARAGSARVLEQLGLAEAADRLARTYSGGMRRKLDHGEPQVEEATRRVSISVEAGTDRLRDALASLDAMGTSIDDIALRPPTLDEVFLALTGQALDEATDAAGHDETGDAAGHAVA